MDTERVSLNSEELIESGKVLICYKGPFLDRVLNLIGEKINTLFNENPRLNKKVFSIFIELAQNIAYYSEKRYEDENGIGKTFGEGSFVISESDDFYTLTSSNLIKKSWEKEVVEKCDMINKLDTDGLRKLKRELRNRPRHEGQLGGNIGLVDIALKAGTSLNVDISSEDEQFSFFTLAIDVPKENQ
jgi:hypothetical protein